MVKRSFLESFLKVLKPSAPSPSRQSVTLARFSLLHVERVCSPQVRKRLQRGDVLEFESATKSAKNTDVWLVCRHGRIGAIPLEDAERIGHMLQQDVPLVCRIIGVDPNGDDTTAVRVEVAFLT